MLARFRVTQKLLATALSWLGSIALGLAVFVGLASACQPRSAPGPVEPDPQSLPVYTPLEATLFDDSISLETVDPTLADRRPHARRLLGQRTFSAVTVVAARFATISELGRSFDLTLEPTGRPFRGAPLPGPTVLRVDQGTPAFSFLQTYGTQLIGKSVIVFLRSYNVEGTVRTRFRIEADNPTLRREVENAAARTEFES